MRVIVRVVPEPGATEWKEWPDGWPIPRLGEYIELPSGDTYSVSTVAYYPQGDDEDESPEPFIYVVAQSITLQ
jgi:hypothetical protein